MLFFLMTRLMQIYPKIDPHNKSTTIKAEPWQWIRQKIATLRWLPRVFTNALFIERELEKETQLISLKVFPVEIYQYGCY